MGVETALLVAAVAISGATAYEQRQQQKSAAKKDKEARAVAQAEQAAQQTAQTRQQIREERIRRAQILQQSQNTGVAASSGAVGSIGALQTSVGSNLAAASRQAASATAITGLQQDAANLRQRAADTAALGGFLSSAASAGASAFAATATPTQPTEVAPGSFSPATQPNPYDVNNLFR